MINVLDFWLTPGFTPPMSLAEVPMKTWKLLPLLLLAGCVTDNASMSVKPGQWADYHEMILGAGAASVGKQAAPDYVKVAFASCLADHAVKFLTPDERAELDGYARGEHDLTVGESKRITADIEARGGSDQSRHDIDVLADTCPADVPAFHRYLKF